MALIYIKEPGIDFISLEAAGGSHVLVYSQTTSSCSLISFKIFNIPGFWKGKKSSSPKQLFIT